MLCTLTPEAFYGKEIGAVGRSEDGRGGEMSSAVGEQRLHAHLLLAGHLPSCPCAAETSERDSLGFRPCLKVNIL